MLRRYKPGQQQVAKGASFHQRIDQGFSRTTGQNARGDGRVFLHVMSGVEGKTEMVTVWEGGGIQPFGGRTGGVSHQAPPN